MTDATRRGPNHVTSVTLTVETASGDVYTMVTRDPSPTGSNPVFMAEQVAAALEELIASLRGQYDGEGCRHRFPDGTRCTLPVEAHAEVPGVEVHDLPRVTPSGEGSADA